MKIISISDTHGLHRRVEIEETDLLIFAGDCMTSGHDDKELISFLQWFDRQPAKYKVMIAGNHDRFIENFSKVFKKLLLDYPSIIYLEDSWVEIEGYKIYGTPHSKIFHNWAFNKSSEDLYHLYGKIPVDTDILISHAPQYGVLDELVDRQKVGEYHLSSQMKCLGNLKLHVFGHIHNGFGMVKPDGFNYISINASQVNESYRLTNFPIKINI